MRACQLDHIAVTAPSLDAGVAWVEAALGVPLQAGGEHQRMGTHNALLRLGDSAYLEVIAVNPAVPAPGRPRWFGLDRIAPDASPRLATWVARTNDIRSAASGPDSLGQIEQMSRGALSWLITIPTDGSLPGEGVAPTLIQWQTEQHPSLLLKDQGCALVRLAGFHSDSGRILRTLEFLDLQDVVVLHALPFGERPYLVAQIKTPLGLKTLGGPHG
jgi:hypothetical protein